MATAVAQPAKINAPLPGRRYDHVFFSVVVALMVATVIVGFGPTYYYAGVFRAPLPPPIIHVHGALFSCWMLLLVTQTLLISARRVDVHRKLGIAGMCVACAMVVVGVGAATNSLMRPPVVPGRDIQAFYLIPLTDILNFSVLMAFAYRERRDAAAHKRLILIATNALMLAAVARWPIALLHRQVWRASIASDIFLLMLVLYDLWSLRKLHRATLWGGAFFLVIQQIRFPISHTATWHHIAAWVQATFR